MFGIGTLDRPWLEATDDEMAAARSKMATAFEFFTKLGTPYYCFHDRDVAPEGDSFATFRANLDALADDAAGYQQRTGVRLLWGTANLFSHPRYQAGAATNPDPDVFAYAAAQVKHMLEVTQRLGGQNYVLWGGREGYDTLLNTDLRREQAQLARFLHLVAEHKAKIGFTGQLLIEPKPMEPTKHQYDYDVATIYGFLVRNGLEREYKVNIEANHATLAGHSFHHEVAFAAANGILGSIDANRGDPQNGWDTDQFPNSVDDLAMPIYEILLNGGLTPGGFNFDAKLRRQSSDRNDLFYAHVGGLDALAQALLAAASMVEDGSLRKLRDERYAGWNGELGSAILGGSVTLAELERRVGNGDISPIRRSGHQEMLESLVNQHIWSAGRPNKS
jgi:xylose isomerase